MPTAFHGLLMMTCSSSSGLFLGVVDRLIARILEAVHGVLQLLAHLFGFFLGEILRLVTGRLGSSLSVLHQDFKILNEFFAVVPQVAGAAAGYGVLCFSDSHGWWWFLVLIQRCEPTGEGPRPSL